MSFFEAKKGRKKPCAFKPENLSINLVSMVALTIDQLINVGAYTKCTPPAAAPNPIILRFYIENINLSAEAE